METSKPLAIESFSYSWLSNIRPSLDPPYDHSSHGEANFDFNVSVTVGPTSTFVPADELFYNGLIRPTSPESPVAVTPDHYDPHTPPPPTDGLLPARRTESGLLRRWRRSSEQALQKCFRCLFTRSFHRKEGFYTRKNVRVRSWLGSPPAAVSPSRTSAVSYSAGEWRDEIESSIYEAVLHCKRSIE
ncbi:hypothetical protein SAY87_015017 [Trapa incisa]|uniref:Membrane-associated kinase regulator 6 n=2 Tax=Trapa TaxID=22665 RepID=A0AAN7N1D4_TRANT|nr:hypothetical protein SAY87_015017 [Trapa incisa]KAK4802208.1 hypothetical protein SAY86_000411 [Trapa natans]